MNLNTLKIILCAMMFLVVYLGLIPKKVEWCMKTKLPLSLLNCFAAGIFLAMAVVHILPEASEIWEEYTEKEQIEDPFPLPYVCYLIGYILILGIDRVVAEKYHVGDEN
jgi:zinc transporter 1/2/3